MIRLIWAIARRAAVARVVELDAANQGEKSSDRKGQIYTQMRGVLAAAVAHASVARIMHSALVDRVVACLSVSIASASNCLSMILARHCLPKHRDMHLREDGRSSVVSCFDSGTCDSHVVYFECSFLMHSCLGYFVEFVTTYESSSHFDSETLLHEDSF